MSCFSVRALFFLRPLAFSLVFLFCLALLHFRFLFFGGGGGGAYISSYPPIQWKDQVRASDTVR